MNWNRNRPNVLVKRFSNWCCRARRSSTRARFRKWTTRRCRIRTRIVLRLKWRTEMPTSTVPVRFTVHITLRVQSTIRRVRHRPAGRSHLSRITGPLRITLCRLLRHKVVCTHRAACRRIVRICLTASLPAWRASTRALAIIPVYRFRLADLCTKMHLATRPIDIIGSTSLSSKHNLLS